MTSELTGVERVLLRMTGALPRHLFVLVGPSGVGKHTITQEVLATYQPLMGQVRTYTTRHPRADEIDGAQYHFVSREAFRALALAGKLMEADAEHAGHDVYEAGDLYSMPADLFQDIPPEKHLVWAEVDTDGAQLLQARYPDCVTIFVTAPPLDLLERILRRSEDTDRHMNSETLARRMAAARKHIRAAKQFDYIVFNEDDRIDEAVAAVKGIIESERRRVRHGVDLEAILPEEAFDALGEREGGPVEE
jgi:guanylate kinase